MVTRNIGASMLYLRERVMYDKSDDKLETTISDNDASVKDSLSNMLKDLNLPRRYYQRVAKYCRAKEYTLGLSISSLEREERLEIWLLIKDDVPTTYALWLAKVKNFTGGGVGVAIALLTIVVTGVAAVLGVSLFPPGKYPHLVLALPGLIIGALFFFFTTYQYWNSILSLRIQQYVTLFEEAQQDT